MIPPRDYNLPLNSFQLFMKEAAELDRWYWLRGRAHEQHIEEPRPDRAAAARIVRDDEVTQVRRVG